MIIRINKKLDLRGFYKQFLRHASIILPAYNRLTDMEAEVLTEFYVMDDAKFEGNRFGLSGKRYVREAFEFNNYSNLDNYLKALVDKGYLVRDGRNYKIVDKYNLPKKRSNGEDIRDIKIVYSYGLGDGE